MTNPNPLPPLEFLRETFVYNSNTGKLSWRIPGRGREQEKVGCVCPDGYAKVNLNYKPYLLHRLIWKIATGNDPLSEIDHINGVRSDNRICNLREATTAQNKWNASRKGKGSNPLRGVRKSSSRWIAQIACNGKKIYIGTFDTAELAHNAYWVKAQELHGEFAKRE